MTPVEFLHREESFVAVAKQSGDLVIPDRFRTSGPSLFDRTREALGGGELLLVHRLDRGTSGVVLFARSTGVQRAISTAFEGGAVAKEYRALVDAVPEKNEGRVSAPIAAGRKGRMKIATGGKPSVTNWRVIERFAAHAWLDVRPETGRTHQIRVHLGSVDMPIVGDDRYNFSKREPALPRLALHAFAVSFPLDGETRRIEAPLPADLVSLLERLRRP